MKSHGAGLKVGGVRPGSFEAEARTIGADSNPTVCLTGLSEQW